MKDSATTFFKVYDRLAQGYDFAFGPILRHGQKMAMKAMDIKPRDKVLEVGIGTGLTLPLYRSDQDVMGIDLSEGMLAKAKERIKKLGMTNTHVQVMSAEKLEFEDNIFDIVFAPSVFSVVSDPQKTIDEMLRVLKPTGTACIVSHFAGTKPFDKVVDRLADPLTRKLVGFRMTTPKQVVENHPHAHVILKKSIFALNFGTLYLLKRKNH